MIQSLLFLAVLSAPGAAAPPAVPSSVLPQETRSEKDAEKKIVEAGDDVQALLALAEGWKGAGQKDFARLAFERVLELDPENEAAHKGLRHHFYAGQWFESYASLSKFKREEAKRMKEKGFVRFRDEWVREGDLPFLQMGWTKVGDRFRNPVEIAAEAQARELTAKGYQQRAEDSSWVAPSDFDKWKEGLYRVEGEWVSGEEADAYHAGFAHPWRYRGKHFIAQTTCDHIPAASVVWWADATWDSLVRLFGVEPETMPVFACLRSLEQYNAFAAGDSEAGVPAAESGGFSSFHFAFRGDLWFVPPTETNPIPEYIGGGVAFYDVSDPSLQPWGQYAARYAAGISFAEWVDRAWGTIGETIAAKGVGLQPSRVWEEKRIPRWLFYGGASYVERFFRDTAAEKAGGDPWGVRNWAIGQLAAAGDLDPLEELFEMRLDLNDAAGSSRRLQEVGLLTAFVLDGGCKPVEEAHASFREAMASGADTADAVAALQTAILEHRRELEKFAGMKIARPGKDR